MRARLAGILMVPLMAVGASCGGEDGEPRFELDPNLRSKVTDLHFEPEHEVTIDGPCLLEDSELGICLIDGDYEETIPDTWTMQIEQYPNGPRPTSEEELDDRDTAETEIRRREFRMLEVGDVVTIENFGQEDQRVTRVPQ